MTEASVSQSQFCHFVKQCNMTAEIPAHNVCRINVQTRGFDWTVPPNKSQGKGGTGTGFVLNRSQLESGKGVFVITAHHVVANAISIRVYFDRVDSIRREAKIVGSNPEMDVSILHVPYFNKSEQLDGLKIGNSDEVQALEKVMALGFALGKDHMQSTAGVVSGRIAKPCRLQIDVAVNPGNSGGPLLNEKAEVVGIVTSGMTNAQNINYAAPFVESLVIIRRIIYCYVHNLNLTTRGDDKIVMDRLPKINCTFTRANRVLLESINDSCKTGMYCSNVHSNVKRLQQGDIVCQMEVQGRSYEIDLQMAVKFDFWKDRLPMETIFDRLQPNSIIKLKFWRDKQFMESDLKLTNNKFALREYYPELEAVPYASCGGIIVMPLTFNHLSIFSRNNLALLVNLPEIQENSIPIITRILAESPFHESETIGTADIVTHVNNVKIQNVEEFHTQFENAIKTNNEITIRCRDGSLATASVKSIVDAHSKIRTNYDEKHIGLFT